MLIYPYFIEKNIIIIYYLYLLFITVDKTRKHISTSLPKFSLWCYTILEDSILLKLHVCLSVRPSIIYLANRFLEIHYCRYFFDNIFGWDNIPVWALGSRGILYWVWGPSRQSKSFTELSNLCGRIKHLVELASFTLSWHKLESSGRRDEKMPP